MNSIAEYNKNLSFLKRFYAYHSMENTNPNHTYARFNCKRVTLYVKDDTRKTTIKYISLATNLLFGSAILASHSTLTLAGKLVGKTVLGQFLFLNLDAAAFCIFSYFYFLVFVGNFFHKFNFLHEPYVYNLIYVGIGIFVCNNFLITFLW